MNFWSLDQKIWEGFKRTNEQTNEQTTHHCYHIVTDENCSSGTKSVFSHWLFICSCLNLPTWNVRQVSMEAALVVKEPAFMIRHMAPLMSLRCCSSDIWARLLWWEISPNAIRFHAALERVYASTIIFCTDKWVNSQRRSAIATPLLLRPFPSLSNCNLG